MHHWLLTQLLAQPASALLQSADLRHGSFDALRRGSRLLEVESAFERTFFTSADRRELRAEVADIGDRFGVHRSPPRRKPPMDAVSARPPGRPCRSAWMGGVIRRRATVSPECGGG